MTPPDPRRIRRVWPSSRDNQLRRGARQLIGIVVFGDPEAVVAQGFGVLRQR